MYFQTVSVFTRSYFSVRFALLWHTLIFVMCVQRPSDDGPCDMKLLLIFLLFPTI